MQSTDKEQLFANGILSEDSYKKLSSAEAIGLFSIGMELKALLYAGVLLLTSGLGIAIYQNLDSIGHMAVIAFIAAISAGSFYYCYRKSLPYSNEKVISPDVFFDYVLLLGGLTLVSFIGYLQFQYSIFGTLDGMTFLIAAIVLFAAAYYFDHLGILSMAITTFAAFAGISISPLSFFESNNFSLHPLIFTGIGLGSIYILAATILSSRNIKKHFTLTYYNFGAHLLFIFTLTGLMEFDGLLFILLLGVFTYLCIRYSNRSHSFYFMLIAVFYGYFGLTYLFFRFISRANLDILALYAGLVYLIISSILIIRFLRNYRNKLRAYDSI